MINTLLFIPLENKEFIKKAYKYQAGIYVFDLEDSVFVDNKVKSRQIENHIINKYPLEKCAIRINSINTEWWQDDILFAKSCGIQQILVPKVNSNLILNELIQFNQENGFDDLRIIPIIETYEGVKNAEEIILNPIPDIYIFGSEDYLADIGYFGSRSTTNKNPFLRDALLEVAKICHKYDKLLIDTVYPFIGAETEKDLKEECNFGLSVGTIAKVVIHPSQINVINLVYDNYYVNYHENYLSELKTVIRNMKENGKIVTLKNNKMFAPPELRKYLKINKRLSKINNTYFNQDFIQIVKSLLPYE
jgi:citrate lyase beta subunit